MSTDIANAIYFHFCNEISCNNSRRGRVSLVGNLFEVMTAIEDVVILNVIILEHYTDVSCYYN